MKEIQVPKNSWEGTGLFLKCVEEVLLAIALSTQQQATVTQSGDISLIIVAITIPDILAQEVVLIAADM